MLRNYFMAAVMFAAGSIFVSCTQDVETADAQPATPQETRAYGDKSPIISCYVEINDNDPRIVTSYKDCNNRPAVDMMHLFASNIHADGAGDPCIYFNDKMAPMFASYATYINPIKAAGIKVLLTVLGDWQHIGVANLSVAQANRFADILVYIVDTYGLDGISFDDEYADYNSLVSGSFTHVIKALHAKLDQKYGAGNKIISVFQWGNYNQIDATAGAMIDWADHGYFGYSSFQSASNINGMTNDRWMPMAINLGSSFNALQLTAIKNNAAKTKSQGYGGIMLFNMRRYSEVSPLPVLQKIYEGAFPGCSVTYDGTDYTRSWTPDPNGYTITKNDVPQYLPTYTGK